MIGVAGYRAVFEVLVEAFGLGRVCNNASKVASAVDRFPEYSIVQQGCLARRKEVIGFCVL